MQKHSIGIIAACLAFLAPCLCFADGEYRGIIPGKLAWALDSIVEQWTQNEDSASQTIEQTLYNRSGETSDDDPTPIEERFNRQLVITIGFINLGSETYRLDSSSRLEASIELNDKTVRVDAVPAINKTVLAPNGRVKRISFVLKMNNRAFNEAFDKRYRIADLLINPACGKLLFEDAKGNSLLDNVEAPAEVNVQTPLFMVNTYVFPELKSAFTVKDALLTINKTNNILAGNENSTQSTFLIDNGEIGAVVNIPNNDNYKVGFSNNDLGWLLMFMFNNDPVDNDKTAEILSKPLRSKDKFVVGIAPTDVLKEYFPNDETGFLVTFKKCIEKLPESVAPKRYQEVNIKCVENLENPFKVLKQYADSGDDEAVELIVKNYDPKSRDGFLYELFPDKKSFFLWLKQRADNGSAQAQLSVGALFDYGLIVKENPEKALKYYKMSAKQNNDAAMVNYAKVLHRIDRDKNKDEIIEWLRKAAERKNPQGQYLLAVLLFSTQDNEQIKEGLLWLQQAAFEGYPDAMFALALEYFMGRNIPRDDKKAFELMEKAALDKGLIKAYDILGDFYMKGIGVERDEKKAFLCYQIGAENGIPNSMYWCGYFLCFGVNVEKDVSKGFKLIKEAAEKGNTEAMVFISLNYYKGGFAEKNEKKAFYWLEKAYNEGNEFATGPLGDYYMFGVGVKADREKALELYKRSADKGFPYGYFRWGQYLYEQKGENAQLGLDYIKKAAKTGLKIAQDYLDNLEESADDNDYSKIDDNPDDVDDLDDADSDPFDDQNNTENDVDDSKIDDNQDSVDDLDEEDNADVDSDPFDDQNNAENDVDDSQIDDNQDDVDDLDEEDPFE